MMHKTPGKFYREGISFKEVVRMFSENDTARKWIGSNRWKDRAYCHHCSSCNVKSHIMHPKMTLRCWDYPKKIKQDHGTVGKTTVFVLKEREFIIADTKKETVRGLIKEKIEEGTEIHSDSNQPYQGLENHKMINQNIGEYVRDNVHTNGIESRLVMLKRGHRGAYHKMSHKHLQRYVVEFVGRHNNRKSNIIDQMYKLVLDMNDKRLGYQKQVDSNA